MMSLAIMPFLNECIKMRYIRTQKTSLKLKHQKNKVNYKEIEVVDYSTYCGICSNFRTESSSIVSSN
jgi:hypothetical protein